MSLDKLIRNDERVPARGISRSGRRLAAFVALACGTASAAAPIDTIRLADPASERAHAFASDHDEVVADAALAQPARRLLSIDPARWDGGRISFDLAVDPTRENYVTVRLWGGEANRNRLVLFCDGKQLGYHHLGDHDLLDYGSDAPPFAGRFVYTTTPLPLNLTTGRGKVRLEIRGSGPIQRFGGDFAAFQQPMEGPSKLIFAAYSHVQPFFEPAPDEAQGTEPKSPPTRAAPGPEVLEAVRRRVDDAVDGILADKRPPGQLQLQLLGRAYHQPWSRAYRSESLVRKVVEGVDALATRFRVEPKIAETGPGVYNPDWLGLGPTGDAVRLVASAIPAATLDAPLDGVASRRQAWADMFAASVDFHRRHRPQYTNQSMIKDLNLYRSNRGLRAIAPARAFPEAEILGYLYESVGIRPWLGSLTDSGPARPLGDGYYEVTQKGLTRELGYVGYYGEVLDWVTHIYEATGEPGKPASGDARILEQLVKMERARAVFRYPLPDAEGNRAMRMEAVVGWRDDHYPGEVTYAERSAGEGSAIFSPAATLDPASVGAAQQMFADNQFFASVADLMNDSSLRNTLTLALVPGQYERMAKQPPIADRLPMTPGQPDFVFSDEEAGVVAIKHGDDILYVSLYWRARYAINFLARVHYVTPTIDRLATVRTDVTFVDSGQVYRRRDGVGKGFGDLGPAYPGVASAHAGEALPIATVPAGIKFRPGDENGFAGKGDLYTLRYGPYVIAMNMTQDRDFDLKATDAAVDLVSRRPVAAGTTVKVAPRSTVVLYSRAPG